MENLELLVADLVKAGFTECILDVVDSRVACLQTFEHFIQIDENFIFYRCNDSNDFVLDYYNQDTDESATLYQGKKCISAAKIKALISREI